MTLMIQYNFTDDLRYFTCYMSYVQYLAFRQLSIIHECKVLKRNQTGYMNYVKEMQIAIDALAKNDKTLLGKLSWPKYYVNENGMIIIEKKTTNRFS